MRSISLLLFISLSSQIFAQVENWGGPIERIENVLGFGFACDRADRAEVEYIDCQIPTLKVTGVTEDMNLDQITEELIFLEAARRNHQFVSCQEKLHQGLKDQSTRSNLKKNAFLQFQNIRESLGDKLKEKTEAETQVGNFRSSNFSEDRFNTRYNSWRQERLQNAQADLSKVNGEIQNLVSRVPLGNRAEMKEKLVELLKTNPNISEEKFSEEYEKVLQTLDSQIKTSVAHFDSIKTPQGDGTNLYKIDDDMKMSFIKSGQVSNVVTAYGMEERLSKGFVCRSRARYETGPVARKALEIPLYFAGAYGLGRLAVRAAVSGAKAISMAARAGMIGLDLAQIAEVTSETMDACFPPEFLSGSLDENCSAESEISSVYQEADIASCVTSATLGVGSVAFVGGVRLWGVMSARAATKAKLLSRLEPEENVIVVTARRERLIDRARSQPQPLSKLAQAKKDLTEQKMSNLLFVRNTVKERTVVTALSDRDMRRGIRAAFNRLHDKEALTKYITDLQEDTFQAMMRDPKLRSAAQWGRLDKDTMVKVLEERVKARGSKFVYIAKIEGGLSTKAFNERIGKGYLVDHGFPEGVSHGTYTHLLQQDFTYETIMKASGKSHDDVIKFFGTEDGMKVWDQLFDAGGNTPTSPEYFMPRIMKENLPLGFIPGRIPRSSDRSSLPA